MNLFSPGTFLSEEGISRMEIGEANMTAVLVIGHFLIMSFLSLFNNQKKVIEAIC